MKNLLIISPNFPPNNAADMHRVRQSVNYFREFGWNPIVVMVYPNLTEFPKEEMLVQTVPADLEIHYVKALPSTWTRKIGLGDLALRSLPFYLKKVNQLLKQKKQENRPIELIYFSTTMFPVCVLGNYWKTKFKIPYVIDMQDPWFTDYYLKRPKHERPPKFWFSYRLHKFLEPIAMKKVDGIVSVSEGYCTTLQKRYPNITLQNCLTLPFGAFEKDMQVAAQNSNFSNHFFDTTSTDLNLVYVGRGGHDMKTAAHITFQAIQEGKKQRAELFNRLKLFFIGTDYSSTNPKQTIFPIAQKYNLEDVVREYPERIPYFDTLRLLQEAHALLIFGSIDKNYTASKLYPYILSKKPIFAVFYEESSAVHILQETQAGEVAKFSGEEYTSVNVEQAYELLTKLLERVPYQPNTDWQVFETYTARQMTRKQSEFFNRILS